MPEIESEGKTIPEAVESALRSLGLTRDQVEIEVLQEASAGFLGMGAKPARVRVAEKGGNGAAASRPQAAARQAPTDTSKACAETQSLVEELLELMGLDAQCAPARWDGVQERICCVIDGPDSDRLIAGDARPLESLQFLITLIVSRKLGEPVAVQVDANGYWSRREQEIIAQAQKGIAEVQASGKPFRLQPMEPGMRRLIHRHFMDHPQVQTASEGEGPWRKIVIRPRKR